VTACEREMGSSAARMGNLPSQKAWIYDPPPSFVNHQFLKVELFVVSLETHSLCEDADWSSAHIMQ